MRGENGLTSSILANVKKQIFVRYFLLFVSCMYIRIARQATEARDEYERVYYVRTSLIERSVACEDIQRVYLD